MEKEDLKSLYWLKKEIQREKLNSSGGSRMKELQRHYDEIRREIYAVKDTQVRVILLLRYVDGMSWKSIAQRLGGGNGPDSCRLYRQGSPYEKVFVHYLIVQRCEDEDVMAAIRDRADTHEAVMRALKARIRKVKESVA